MESCISGKAGDTAWEEPGDKGLDNWLAVFENSPTCLTTLDANQRIMQVNPAFLAEFGRAAFEVIGTEFGDLVHPDSAHTLRKRLAMLVNGERAHVEEDVLMPLPDGGTFTGRLTAIAATPDHEPADEIFVMIQQPGELPGAPGLVRHELKLSRIDADILEGIAAGIPIIRLAERLHLSRQGVDYHVQGMQRRLRTSSRSALVARAYNVGLFLFDSWPPRVRPDLVKGSEN